MHQAWLFICRNYPRVRPPAASRPQVRFGSLRPSSRPRRPRGESRPKRLVSTRSKSSSRSSRSTNRILIVMQRISRICSISIHHPSTITNPSVLRVWLTTARTKLTCYTSIQSSSYSCLRLPRTSIVASRNIKKKSIAKLDYSTSSTIMSDRTATT